MRVLVTSVTDEAQQRARDRGLFMRLGYKAAKKAAKIEFPHAAKERLGNDGQAYAAFEKGWDRAMKFKRSRHVIEALTSRARDRGYFQRRGRAFARGTSTEPSSQARKGFLDRLSSVDPAGPSKAWRAGYRKAGPWPLAPRRSRWAHEAIAELRRRQTFNEAYQDLVGDKGIDEARSRTKIVVAHFLQGKPKRVATVHTDGESLYMHGNKIAQHAPGGIWISHAGWNTATTAERLRHLMHEIGHPGVSRAVKHGKMYVHLRGGEKHEIPKSGIVVPHAYKNHGFYTHKPKPAKPGTQLAMFGESKAMRKHGLGIVNYEQKARIGARYSVRASPLAGTPRTLHTRRDDAIASYHRFLAAGHKNPSIADHGTKRFTTVYGRRFHEGTGLLSRLSTHANGWHAEMLAKQAASQKKPMADVWHANTAGASAFNVPAKAVRKRGSKITYRFKDGSETQVHYEPKRKNR